MQERMPIAMTVNFPMFIQEILYTLHNAGFEAYLVGGCVRDTLLGKAPLDWDITTNALPETVMALFPHCIPTGIQHGTVTVVWEPNCTAEVTTYRTDGIYEDGRHPKQVSFATTLEDDLSRRDFTMNAIAYSPFSGFVDLFQGQEHMNQKKIYCVGDPMVRFSEDALRMLRAIRFSAVLGFAIDPAILQAIAQLRDNIKKVSIERIQAEFSKTLLTDYARAVQTLWDTGLCCAFLPELTAAPDMTYLVSLPKRLPCRLAALLQALPLETAQHILKRLRYSNAITSHTISILKNMAAGLPTTETELRQRLADKTLQRGCPDYLEMQGDENILSTLERIQQRGDCTSLSALAVNGDDLTKINITDGKKKGTVLQALLQAVLENPSLNTKEQLIEIALRIR